MVSAIAASIFCNKLLALLSSAAALLAVDVLLELAALTEVLSDSPSLNRLEIMSSTLGAPDVPDDESDEDDEEVLLRLVCNMPSWLLCDISVCIWDCIFSRLATRAAVSSLELRLPSPSVSKSVMSDALTPNSEAETNPFESVSFCEMMLEASLLSISSMLKIELELLVEELICI
ncbi:hypothetical protein JCM14124_08500 [Humidesulfovibrio idahonensis]